MEIIKDKGAIVLKGKLVVSEIDTIHTQIENLLDGYRLTQRLVVDAGHASRSGDQRRGTRKSIPGVGARLRIGKWIG